MAERTGERRQQVGIIEVIYGPMFSSKSDELIKVLKIAEKHGREIVQAFYPHIDNRGKPGTINTADGDEFPATEVFSSREIAIKLRSDVTMVGIDEAQFMDMDLPRVCIELAAMGKTIVVAGLGTDFKNDVFGPMGAMLAVADKTTKKTARCEVCGRIANRTQRLVDEGSGQIRPARRTEDVIDVGGKKDDVRGNHSKRSFYEARCADHHVVLED